MLKRLAIGLLCVLALAGCSKSPSEKAAAHREKAAAYLKDGKLDEAVLELRSALQAVPKDKEALLRLGEAYLKKGQLGDSFQAYRRAAEIDPKDVEAQVKLGTFYVLGKKLDEAKRCSDFVAATAPNRADGHILLAKIHLQEGSPERAFREFDRAVELDPDNLEHRLVRATAFMSARRLDDARKAVEEVLAKDAVHATALLLLAQIAELQKDSRGAEAAFARLLKAKPDDPGAWMNYGNFWLSRGDQKQGADAFRKAAEVEKKGTAALERLAELYLDRSDLPAAKQTVADIRARAEKSLAATFFDGRIALAEGRLDDAAAKLGEVAKQYPDRPEIHYFMGLTSYRKRNIQQAKAEFQKALELNPGFLKARLLLGQVHLDQREFDMALKQTNEIFKVGRVPAEVVLLRAGALLGTGKASESRALLEKLVAQAPDNARAWGRLGLAYLAEKKLSQALEAFSKVSEVDPKNLDALTMSAQILVSQKKADEAVARVESQMKRAGESAGAHELLGKLFVVKQNPDRAVKEFERAIEVDPNAVEAYLALAALHRGADARQKALADADKALAKKPQYLQAWMLKGALFDQGQQFDEANKAYRKSLEIKPDLVPALNNLAWNLAEHGGNIDEALKFAEKAVELAPKAAVVQDTLGWIYVKKGVYLKAAGQLEAASEGLPKNSAVLYHLGAAYAGSGNYKKAVAVLERALAMDKDFPGAEDARKLLDRSRIEARKKV